jgi:hypothetical protein
LRQSLADPLAFTRLAQALFFKIVQTVRLLRLKSFGQGPAAQAWRGR